MASLSSRSDRNTPRLRLFFVSLAKKPSMALSQEADVGVKWKTNRRCFSSHSHDVGMLVGGIVVDDDMDRLFLGHSGLDDVQKPDELLMAMALHALANNLALKDNERREQGGDAMALVIMGYGASAPLLHRQTRLSTIKRLNLALFVNRQDNGVAGRIDIEADDLVQFGRELGIVGQLELAHPVRLEAMSTPYPLYRADANSGRLRHRRTGPVTGRRRRPSQRQGDHTFSNLRAQRWNARSPCLVPPKASGSFVAETFLPALNPRLGLVGSLHDLRRARPAAVRRTIFARQMCFCGLLRLATTASARLNWIFVRSCIAQTRTRECFSESPSESNCQI